MLESKGEAILGSSKAATSGCRGCLSECLGSKFSVWAVVVSG